MTIEAAKLLESVRRLFGSDDRASGAKPFAITKLPQEWRQALTAEQYRVLRDHGTERPGSSPMLKEDRNGIYRCAGCGEAVYASDARFDSGTGWPSFTASVDDNVETKTDRSLLMARTEVHCAKCGGHLGHRFADGPGPTGMRHCINGCALRFDPD